VQRHAIDRWDPSEPAGAPDEDDEDEE
jgi:hypothetical protein